MKTLLVVAAVTWGVAVTIDARPDAAPGPAQPAAQRTHAEFLPSHECQACHNGLTSASGEDVSIGVSWRASMMANSSRDPYWHASVRRETLDHPTAAAEIENECAICHMPMSATTARAEGRHAEIFAHLSPGAQPSAEDVLAADGVSCSLCHQIGNSLLGTRESFVGGFVIGGPDGAAGARMLGPYNVDAGRSALMRSATGATPTEATHLRESEMCATCHTLITTALDASGRAIGSLPEQVPYLEWRHSAWRGERSCQSCHMPAVEGPTRIASVLGEPREGLARHTFLGGNFFMLRMLNRYRDVLGVEAPAPELDAAARATVRQLEMDTASVAVIESRATAVALEFEVAVQNRTGHKLPTGYPSRRVWLHVTVRNRDGQPVFESGAVTSTGLIQGNDADADPLGVEPHYDEIRTQDQVQIYEAVMADPAGRPTTGLLQATQYVKDNRLLPRGFDKATAEADIAVHGAAAGDADFTGEGDRVRYGVPVAAGSGPWRVEVALRYQPIGFRWADNLRRYNAAEPRRFVSWYDAMASSSSVALARVAFTLGP